MHPFPFSEDEWRQVAQASHAVLNATLRDDDVVSESLFLELVEVLNELRRRHGAHPVLWETEADFLSDPKLRRNTYYSALELAVRHALPTLSIRISLAELLLADFADPEEAIRQLRACEHELETNEDAFVYKEWKELRAKSLQARERN